MEILKNLAVTIATLIVFVSMANIILPKNSMKNHVKFVLSLIVLAAMIIPITDFLSLGKDLENYRKAPIFHHSGTAIVNEGNAIIKYLMGFLSISIYENCLYYHENYMLKLSSIC